MESKAQQWLRAFIKQYRNALVTLLALKVLMIISQVLCFWTFSQLMYQLIVEQQKLNEPLFFKFVVSIGSWAILKFFSDWLQLRTKLKIETELESLCQQRLLAHQKVLIGKTSSYYWHHIWLTHIPSVATYLSEYQIQKWLSGLIPLLVIGSIFPVNYLIAILLMVTLPLIPVFMILVGHGAAKLHRQHFLALERLGGLFIDRLKGMTLIAAFKRHDHETERLKLASEVVNQRTMRVVSVAFLSNTVLDFFATVSMALIAVFIGFNLLGEINVGPDIAFSDGLYLLLISPLLFSELKALGRFYHQKAEAEAASEALSPLYDIKDTAIAPQSNKDFHWQSFEVTEPVLYAESLSIKRGQHIKLSGPSGSGKTVLLEALMGLRACTHRLPENIAFVGQHAVITPFTVAENLALDAVFSDAELLAVIEQVGLTQWLSNLPEGLYTMMGEYPPMSGGEAHRLALARVLLRKPNIVLLDEPTAHLPEHLHIQLSQLIHTVFVEQTLIWASHKTLPMEWFDKEWSVDNGTIHDGKHSTRSGQ
ncbi:ABC transporter transmembrane domain-containing protein [Psychrosphaera sp.]|nr:ABC transporter transmembrane domain-containing protein [Psychrosphaera sp.]